ncbi:MAG: alkane 1-monooxygenase [Lacibacter sp.]
MWSKELTLIEFAGSAISLGIINGVLGFTLAHEFVHRHTIPEKTAAWLLLLQNNYPHYGIEHVKGHHVYACTPDDPHAAAMNESFYHFLPRSVKFTAVNAWRIEVERLKRRGKRIISFQNRVAQHILIHLLLYCLLFAVGNWHLLLFYLIQSAVAIVLLHMADYLQHYGLQRKEIDNQKYERISAFHAWGNTHAKAGFNLFQLDKHADHHLHPSHRYETLLDHAESPELPAAYSSMMLIALVPGLWFKKMNKLIPSALL